MPSILSFVNHNKLGFINIAVCYLSFSINAIFAVKVNKVLGTKCTLLAAALTYAFWMASFLLPAYRKENNITTGIYSDTAITTINILASFIIGAGAGPLWVS